MDLNDLIAERAKVWGQMCAIMDGARDEGRDLEAQEAETYDRLEGRISDLSDQIERQERHSSLESKLTELREEPVFAGDRRDGSVTEARGEDVERAFGEYLKRGVQGMSPEARQLMEARWVQGDEMRAQGISTDAAGGYSVPEGFWNRVSEVQVAFGGMLDVANVITTETGAALPWPTNDDTGNVGAILSENTQVTEQDVTLGQRSLGSYTYTSKLIRVSYQLLQDSAFNLENWLTGKLGQRLGRIHNTHFTTGTGTAQPEGVQTNATTGVTGATGQTTSVTYADLIDLEHSVNQAYRGNGRFMFNDNTLASLRKIVDADGRPLWQPSVVAGVASTINGKPYTVNDDMPDMAANAKAILFGDFREGYVIRRVRGMQVLRLQERYADFLQVGFLAFDRMDGVPDQGAAIRAYANSAT